MAIIHSSDLGWKAGQNISSEFAALAKTFKAGDTFVFDHMYKISGTAIALPDDFTLAGGAPGAGIDVIDTATNSKRLFDLGDSNALIDLTVKHSNAPTIEVTTLNPDRGHDFHDKITFSASGKDDLKIVNSHFEGNVGIFVHVSGGDNLLVQDTKFYGGLYQMRISQTTNTKVQDSLFEEALGDGIKTSGGKGGESVEGAIISGSVFLNNNRDGIDATGGLKDSVVTDSYFIGGFVGIDVKSILDSDDDFDAGTPRNDNLLITNSEFININNAVVVTTLDRGNYLDKENATKWAAQGITLENSTIEQTNGGNGRVFLIKDGYNIHWDDITLLGNVKEFRADSWLDIGLPKDVSGTVASTGLPRNKIDDNAYRNMAGPDWSDLSYPINGTPAPIDTTPPPADPVVVDPVVVDPVVVDPVVEDPVVVDPVVVDPTQLWLRQTLVQ